ncbi:MAG: hypothetical protein ACTS2F_17795 [Thainema sp.]
MKIKDSATLNNLYFLFTEHQKATKWVSLTAAVLGVLSFPIWLSTFSDPGLFISFTFQLPLFLAVLMAVVFCLLEWAVLVSLGLSAYLLLYSDRIDYRKYALPILPIYIFSASMTLSVFLMLVFYPGIVSYDASMAWEQALINEYNAWHPPFLAMIMHLTQFIVKNQSLFTSLQGFAFWSSTFYLLWQIIQKPKFFFVSTVVIALIPQIWLYSNAAISNTSMASFVMLSTACLIRAFRLNSQSSFLLSIICLSIAICFRREAVVLIPIPIGYLFYFAWRQNKVYRALKALPLMLILLIVPGKLVEISPNVTGESPAGQVFLSQYVGTIHNAKSIISEAELEAERQSIDERFGNGTFDLFMGDGFNCVFPMIWARNIRLADKEQLVLEESRFIMHKTIGMMFQYPIAYARHKACNFAHVLQNSRVMYQDWGGITDHPPMPRMVDLNIGLDSKIPLAQEAYGKVMNWMLAFPITNFTFRHYFFYIVSILTVLIGLVARRIEWTIPALFSVVYAFGNLIPDSFPFWRYLFPCYVLAWTCILGMLSELAVRFKPAKARIQK